VAPDTPTHVTGIKQANGLDGYEHQVGHHEGGTADARDRPEEAQPHPEGHAEPAARMNGTIEP
jgi:hypothetical protein